MAASPSRIFTYRYSRVRWGRVDDDVPMATALLSWEGAHLRAKLLVDTGASVTFLPHWMAEKLSLPLQTVPQEAQTPGGVLRVQRTRVRLSLADPDPEGREGRAHLVEPALVAEDAALPFSVLGRKPFLRSYRLTVDEARHEFSLAERA